SLPKTPIIFVLSPGVDPSANLTALAEKMDFRKNFLPLSLGQGQAPIATQNIAEGVRLLPMKTLMLLHSSLNSAKSSLTYSSDYSTRKFCID
ncbi:unnamed protein product, partial [Rotaria magnacalcarata]